MKALPLKAWALWAQLADGKAHHVKDLAVSLSCDLAQLNVYAHQLPEHAKKNLRQQDGWWQFKAAMAVVSPLQAQQISLETGFDVQAVAETTSTNDVLWQRWQAGQDIHQQAVVALSQSQGRGRMQRPWHNQAGQALMFSVAYRLPLNNAHLASLPLIVGLVVQQVLAQQHIQARLKWPNDVVVGDLKLGGVLVESKIRGERFHAVIGIGINVMLPQHEDVKHLATSCQAQQPQFDSTIFLSALFQQLNRDLPRFFEQGFLAFQDAYVQQLRDVGQEVVVYERGQCIDSGMIVGVDTLGGLQLQNSQGHIQIHRQGEISVRRNHDAAPTMPALTEAGIHNQDNSQHKSQQMVSTATHKKDARYLLLDGGNSQLKWAWVDQDQQLHFGGRAPYANLQAFADFLRQFPRDFPILGCAVCGAKKIAAVEQAASGRFIRWLPSMRHALGVTNHYYKVQQHGSDRWFNVLGSRLFSQNSCVVVSCGTAITIDAVTQDHHYLGGSIMPGFNLMKEAMAVKTANLNQPIGKAYPFATSTSNALASGMQDAASGAVILMHQRLKERQQGGQVDIILTGGGAAKIEQHLPKALILDSTVQIVDNLVLFGLKNWVEHTCNY